MSEAELQERVVKALADGYTVVQQGAVLKPPAKGSSFNERVAGFDIHLLGTYGPPVKVPTAWRFEMTATSNIKLQVVRRVTQFGICWAVVSVERDETGCDTYGIGAGRTYREVAGGFATKAEAEAEVAAMREP